MTSQNKQITYSSVSSPSSSKSPNMSTNSPYYNTNNKFSFPTADNPNYSQNGSSPGFIPRNNNFRRNSTYENNGNNQQHQSRMQGHQNSNNNFSQQQQNGISLYIKANNVTEDILKSIFNANVSQAKIVSIDVKMK